MECCLSSPPDDPSSILLLTRTKKPTFIFCRLDCKRKRLKWIELSYAKQLKRISGDWGLLHNLACCDGKVFALNTGGWLADFVIHVDIVVKKDREVVIKLFVFGGCPCAPEYFALSQIENYYLKGSSTELFLIIVGFNEETKKTFGAVTLFKLDMTSINWDMLEGLKDWNMTNMREEDVVEDDNLDLEITGEMWKKMSDLEDAIFLVDLARDYSVFYRSAISSDLGGYIHIRGEMGKIVYSYHLKDKTISVSCMPSAVLPTSHVLLWECRLGGDYVDFEQEKEKDDKIVIRPVTDDKVEYNESQLLDLPFHILEMVMKFCVGVEYMIFRATCKRCHLAAPVVKWRDELTLGRLQNYSLVSPWLMGSDEERGIITFRDPMFGDKYFMNSLHAPIFGKRICYSRFGWLLFYTESELVLCNPFTSNMRVLPYINRHGSFCFSAPPTSPDCMVLLFAVGGDYLNVHIHCVGQEPSWRTVLRLDFRCLVHCSTFYGGDVYALCNEEELHVFKVSGVDDYSWEKDVAKTPRSCSTSRAQYYLTKCDHHLLLVMVEFGGSVEVFKLNDSTKEWEQIDDLGKHAIYICSTTCLCVEAKTKEMENKIYFKQMHYENERIVFYSLDTCTYNTLIGTTYQLNPHVWIQPSCS